MQDVRSQGATSTNRTFGLTADEAGMTWQSDCSARYLDMHTLKDQLPRIFQVNLHRF